MQVVEPLDHTFLNQDIAYFQDIVPTAENIAVYIRDQLLEPVRELGVQLVKIRLDETENNSCEVYVQTEAPWVDRPVISAIDQGKPAGVGAN
jgi:6-pyruvoyltetrahydropterin/6-carboxytetrahydropterin synthase